MLQLDAQSILSLMVEVEFFCNQHHSSMEFFAVTTKEKSRIHVFPNVIMAEKVRMTKPWTSVDIGI